MTHRTMVMVRRTYLHVSIVTLLTAVLWFMLSIYQSLTAPSETAVDPAIKAPLSATLDQEVLENILSREDLSELAFEPPVATASSESAVVINEITPAEPIPTPE